MIGSPLQRPLSPITQKNATICERSTAHTRQQYGSHSHSHSGSSSSSSSSSKLVVCGRDEPAARKATQHSHAEGRCTASSIHFLPPSLASGGNCSARNRRETLGAKRSARNARRETLIATHSTEKAKHPHTLSRTSGQGLCAQAPPSKSLTRVPSLWTGRR